MSEGSDRHPLSRMYAALTGGSRPFVAFIVLVGAALTVGRIFGVDAPLAIVIGLFVFLVSSRILRARKRTELRRQAFVGGGPVVAADADPIEHFFVRPWYGRASEGKLPPFVERRVMEPLLKGLEEERFVILVGKKTSGKSRLVHEAVVRHEGEMAMIAADAPAAGKADPLVELMKDRGAFTSWEERHILILRDLAKRVANREIDGALIRTWLDRHPRIAVVATLNPEEIALVQNAGEGVAAELEMVERRARVIDVFETLRDEELDCAREKFPGADKEQLRHLPAYLASADPLKQKLREGEESHPPGHALVCAVADWWRAVGRPAPESFLRKAAARRDWPDGASFTDELRWALEPVQGAAALIYADSTEEGMEVYTPDRVLLDLLDGGERERPVSDFAWQDVLDAVLAPAEGKEMDEAVAADLISVGEAALARGETEIGPKALVAAGALGSTSQQQQAARLLIAGVESGSRPRQLVSSRRGDGIGQRLRPVKELAEGRRFRAADPVHDDSAGPSPVIAAVYRRHSFRTAVRCFVLILIDVLSSGLGLALALATRAFLSGDLDWAVVWGIVSGPFIAVWASFTVSIFASAGLYVKDASRGRISAIVPAIAVLAASGLIATLAGGFNVLVAVAAALAGALLAFGLDFGLRVAYDKVSRGWVGNHALEARTLCIGSGAQVVAVMDALPQMSRPTFVVGYLSLDPDRETDSRMLGSVDDLAAVASLHGVGRVILADTRLTPAERQTLADFCHARGLLVEMVPSLADIRIGSAGYSPGQPLALVSLHPLWQRNAGFFVKRAMDVVLALFALVLLALPMAIIAALVRFEGGPVLARSWRPGLGGDAFLMYRFRTLPGHQQPRIDLRDRHGVDENLTPLGRKLCNRGLDELPQLLNVLLGHMSLVGPRPLHLHYHVQLEDPDLLRYVVRPGVTGAWQVVSRPVLSIPNLTALDMAYLRHWSIFNDLEILFRTAKMIVWGRKTLPAIALGDKGQPLEPQGQAA